jgi:hypothetical protein
MDFGLKFEFARYLAVYRGIPRHTAIPLGGGKKPAVGKKNPADNTHARGHSDTTQAVGEDCNHASVHVSTLKIPVFIKYKLYK